MAEASRPSTKNVSVKLPRMNAMTSFIEAPSACRRAHLGCDDPHGIIGFVHLRKRELGSARSAIRRVAAASIEACGVVHSSTMAAPPRLGGLAKRPRSYYVPSGASARKAAPGCFFGLVDMTALASPYDRADGPYERSLRPGPPSPPSIG